MDQAMNHRAKMSKAKVGKKRSLRLMVSKNLHF
jgi:hypothetical protein